MLCYTPLWDLFFCLFVSSRILQKSFAKAHVFVRRKKILPPQSRQWSFSVAQINVYITELAHCN